MVVVSSTFSAPTEGVILKQPIDKLIVNTQELGTGGNLYITEHNVIWGGGVRTAGTAAPTLSFLYPTISIHAIQREPSPSFYMVLNYELRLPELGNVENNDEEDYDPEEPTLTQIRFIPPDESDLQAMYVAMTQGQALHPDPADEVDEDDSYMDGEDLEEMEEEFEDAEESAAQPDDAASRLRQLHLDNTNGQYKDAEENGSSNIEED